MFTSKGSPEQLKLQSLAKQGMAYGDGNGKLKPLMDTLRDRLRAKAKGGARQMFKMFKEMDMDGNGTIDADEFRQFLLHWNITLPVEKVQAIMRSYDSDGDGTIDYYEFVKQVLPEDYPSNNTGAGARASWLKTEPGYELQQQTKKSQEKHVRKILAHVRAHVKGHPNRDKILQHAESLFNHHTGIKMHEFLKILTAFGAELSVPDSKLLFQSGMDSTGRVHMRAGDVTGCGRIGMFALFKMLLGSESALQEWLARSGNAKALLHEWKNVPVATTEFHRQGFPDVPNGASIPATIIDQAELHMRAKLREKCGNGQLAPFKVFRGHMPLGSEMMIDLKAFKAALRLMGMPEPDPVLNALFARYDTAGNGKVHISQLQRGVLPAFETQFPRLGRSTLSPIHSVRSSSSCLPESRQTVPNSHYLNRRKTPLPSGGKGGRNGPGGKGGKGGKGGGRWFPSPYLRPPPERVAFGENRPPKDNMLLLYRRPPSMEGELKPNKWPGFE